jgi:hypothetical protein
MRAYLSGTIADTRAPVHPPDIDKVFVFAVASIGDAYMRDMSEGGRRGTSGTLCATRWTVRAIQRIGQATKAFDKRDAPVATEKRDRIGRLWNRCAPGDVEFPVGDGLRLPFLRLPVSRAG